MGKYFNLDDTERRFARKRTIFCLVIYDIISPKRRLKLSKLLEGYGVRVQRSCFEIHTSYDVYRQLLVDLERFYEVQEQDSIIVYQGNKEATVSFSSYKGADLDEDIFL